MSAPRVWVYSPNLVMNEALTMYLNSLGFEAQGAPEGAPAALFDLTQFESPLPPAPRTPCLALVRSAEPRRVAEVQQLGYHGAHRPFEDGGRLAAALRTLLASGATSGSAVGTDGSRPAALDRPSLTARETQVLGLLMLGLPNKRMASRLGISERTIKYHVSSLMRKYGARGRLAVLVRSQA